MDASDSGIRIVDHLNSAGGLELYRLCWRKKHDPKAGSVEKCQSAVERFQHNNTWWVPTLTRFAYHKAFAVHDRTPVWGRLQELAKKFWVDSAVPVDWLRNSEVAFSPVDSAVVNTRRMIIIQQVGLPILAGTDVGGVTANLMLPGFVLHAELAMYVAEGLTPLHALQTATLNPAKMLRATDSLGTVAPGKLADLVLLDPIRWWTSRISQQSALLWLTVATSTAPRSTN
jgi:hypothetical protein